MIISRVTRLVPNVLRAHHRWMSQKTNTDEPIKFTDSQAHLNYRATAHFYEEPREDLPATHNLMMATVASAMLFYVIVIREDPSDPDSAITIKPIYEIREDQAIPILESLIKKHRSNKKLADKLQERLDFYMQNPEKHGGERIRKKQSESNA